jgi:hypothetical protein
MTRTRPMPTATEIATNEVLVQHLGGGTPDSFGRVTFIAYWLDESTPNGVRGQVFTTCLNEFAERNLRRGEAMRIR